MKKRFLDFKSSAGPDEIKKAFGDYAEYLASVAERFPLHAREFAQADWHYNTTDPHCPHDSWLETVEVTENSIQAGGSQRLITINAKFLGAYHDGMFTLSYSNVHHYRLDKPAKVSNKFVSRLKGHGDWLIDEMHLTEDGLVVHEIEFASEARWSICSEDVMYSWNPFQNQKT